MGSWTKDPLPKVTADGRDVIAGWVWAGVKPNQEEQPWFCHEKKLQSFWVSPAWVTFAGSPRDLSKFLPPWGREPWECTCFWGRDHRTQTKPQWECRPPARTGLNLHPVPAASCLIPAARLGFLLGGCHPFLGTRHSFQGCHPFARGFLPSSQGSAWQCRRGLSPPGNLPVRIRLPPRPNPAALSPCQDAVGEGRIRPLGPISVGRALLGDVCSGLRPATSCLPRGTGICCVYRNIPS